MSQDYVEHPVIARSDAGTVLVSPWEVHGLARQRDAADATIAEWERASKPDAFLALSCFNSLDGETVLNYAQWTSDEAHREFVTAHRADLVREIDATVPDIKRPGLVRYRLYRSVGPGAAATGPSTVASIAVYQVDGHDGARELADALAPGYESPDGMAGCHFHADVDGTRLLVLSEWRDEQAYEAFVASAEGKSVRAIVDEFRQLKVRENRLYRLRRKLVHRPVS